MIDLELTRLSAVGAAVSKVGGTIDTVQSTLHQTAQQATEYAKEQAVKRAVEAGAIETTVSIAEVDSLPIQYISNQLRTVVKAVGELDVTRLPPDLEDSEEPEEDFVVEEAKGAASNHVDRIPPDPFTYRPEIRTNKETGHPEWILTETDVDWLAEGCYVLGCAGGGSPAATRIQLRDQLRDGQVMRIIDASALKEDANIYCE